MVEEDAYAKAEIAYQAQNERSCHEGQSSAPWTAR